MTRNRQKIVYQSHQEVLCIVSSINLVPIVDKDTELAGSHNILALLHFKLQVNDNYALQGQ